MNPIWKYYYHDKSATYKCKILHTHIKSWEIIKMNSSENIFTLMTSFQILPTTFLICFLIPFSEFPKLHSNQLRQISSYISQSKRNSLKKESLWYRNFWNKTFNTTSISLPLQFVSISHLMFSRRITSQSWRKNFLLLNYGDFAWREHLVKGMFVRTERFETFNYERNRSVEIFEKFSFIFLWNIYRLCSIQSWLYLIRCGCLKLIFTSLEFWSFQETTV